MPFATSTSIRASALFTASKVGKTGITVKVAVSLNGTVITGFAVSDAVAATEIDSTNQPGVYSYTLASGNTATEGQYLFHFYTSDTTVDQQHLEAVLFCFAWVGYINGAGGNLKPASAFPTNFASQSIDASGRVDVAKVSGTTQTARDLGASVLLSSGTGTGQLDFASGVVKVNVVQWLASTVNALIAGRVDGTIGAVQTGAIGAASFAAGALDAVWSTAARTLTAFGFSVTVSANNDKTGYSLTPAEHTAIGGTDVPTGLAAQGYTATRAGYLDTLNGLVQSIWDRLTSALTTPGSVGKLLVDNINATIASRLAASSYTTPPTALEIRTEMDSNSTKLANADVPISTRSSHTAADVWAVSTRTLSSFGSLVSSIVSGVWDELMAGHTISGSFSKFLQDRIDAVISSRMATSSYTAPDNTTLAALRTDYTTTRAVKLDHLTADISVPPTVDEIRAEMDAHSTRLAYLDVLLSTRLATSGYTVPPTASAIAAALASRTTAVEVTSVVQAGGRVPIRQGDSYYSAEGRSIIRTLINPPDLTGATATFSGAGVTVSATIDATAHTVEAQLSQVNTAAMTIGMYQKYTFKVVYQSTHPATIIEGPLEVTAIPLGTT